MRSKSKTKYNRDNNKFVQTMLLKPTEKGGNNSSLMQLR